MTDSKLDIFSTRKERTPKQRIMPRMIYSWAVYLIAVCVAVAFFLLGVMVGQSTGARVVRADIEVQGFHEIDTVTRIYGKVERIEFSDKLLDTGSK